MTNRQHTDDSNAARKPSSSRRWIVRILLALVLLPLVLIVLLFGAIQLPPTKDFATRAAADMVGRLIGQEVEIEGLRGFVPFNVTLERFSLADAEGEWLTVEEVRLAWSWRALLSGRVVVESLEAGRVAVLRVGAFPPSEKERGPFTLPEIPTLPSWIEVERVAIPRIELGEALIQEDAVFSAEASLLQPGGGEPVALSLSLNRTDAPGTDATIEVRASRDALLVKLLASDEHILPRLLDVDGPALIEVSGEAPLADWRGKVSASLGGDELLTGALGLRRQAEGLHSDAELALNAAHAIVPKALPEYLADSFLLGWSAEIQDDGQLRIKRLGAEGGPLQLLVSGLLDLPGNNLDLQLQASHDDVRPVLGLEEVEVPQAVALMLGVTGNPADLTVSVDASWAEAPLAAGSIGLGLEDGVAVSTSLRVFPPAIFLADADAAVLVADGITLVAEVPILSGERIEVTQLAIGGLDGLGASGNASLDFAGQRGEAEVALSADLGRLAGLFGLAVEGSLALVVRANDAGERLDIDASLTGEGLTLDDTALATLSLALDASLRGWAEGDLHEIMASWQGTADGVSLAAYPGQRIVTDGRVRAESLDEVALEHFALSDGVVSVEGSGRYRLDERSGTLVVDAEAPDLALYGPLAGLDLAGNARVRLEARLDSGGEVGEATLDAAVTQLAGIPDPARSLAGSSLSLEARVGLAEGRALLHALALEGAHARADASGSFVLETGTLEAAVSASLPDLSVARETLGPEAAGSMSLRGTVSGTMEALAAQIALEGAGIAAGPARMEAVTVNASVEGFPQRPSGTVTVEAIEQGQRIDAKAAFALVEALLEVPELRLRLGPNNLTADASYNFDTDLPRANASLEFGDIGAFEVFAGVPLGGTLRGDLSIAPSGDDTNAFFALDASDVVAPFGSIGRATVSGEVSSVLAAPNGRISASAARIDAGATRVDEVSLALEGGMEEAVLSAQASGAIAGAAPFEISLEADAMVNAGRVNLRTLGGTLERHAFSLEGPAVLAVDEAGVRIAPFALNIGDGRIDATATQTPESIDARLAWHDLPLGVANAFGAPEVSGTARGEILLAGTMAAPVASAILEVVELRTALAIEPDAPAVNAALSASVSAGLAEASLLLTMSEATRVTANASTAVEVSLAPFNLSLSEVAMVEARVLGEVLLQDPLSFAGLVDHRVDGTMALDYRVDGPLEMPRVVGQVTIADGRYENAVAGTVLDALTLDLNTTGTDLSATLRATDGGSGSLALDATADLRPESGFPFEVKAVLGAMTVARRDDATAQLDGNLRAAGNADAIAVTGDLRVGPATIVLSVPRGGRIPEVEYIEVGEGAPLGEDDELDSVGMDTPVEITLDISATIPGRVNIRGPGIESEWAGDISVTGTAATPVVRGELRVLRGHLDMLDRRFSLADSLIVLDGSTPPNPFINVRGQTRAAEVTAFLIISGTPDALSLRLESDPPLPQDEVLSRVLFDRPIEDITPVQALQLARAAAELSGTMRGTSALGPSGLLPIDRLDIQHDFDGTGETAVGAGTYLGDDIYVEVRQRLRSGSTAVSVDVELRRNLHVKGDVGSDGRTGVGVEYKRDY